MLVPAVERRIGFVFNQSAVFDTGSVIGIIDFGFSETPDEHGSQWGAAPIPNAARGGPFAVLGVGLLPLFENKGLSTEFTQFPKRSTGMSPFDSMNFST